MTVLVRRVRPFSPNYKWKAVVAKGHKSITLHYCCSDNGSFTISKVAHGYVVVTEGCITHVSPS